MQRMKKLFVSFVVMVIMTFSVASIPGFADYGDFEDYSYDSGSSWDSGSSSSWDWDDDDDYSYSGGSYYYGSSDGDGFLGFFIFLIIIIAIIYFSKKKGGFNASSPKPVNPFEVDENAIEAKIQEKDKMFNKAEFLSWASDLYVKLQYAWSDRDLETIRSFETTELYEQTEGQVKRYIANKQINKLERVSVNVAKLYKFEQTADRDVLSVILESKMIDYIIDENTGNVLKGDKNTNHVNKYVLTFVRKTGTKTNGDGKITTTMSCPNCGAPTTITSSGKCPYCGSIITTKDHNWSLSSLKKYNQNM